MKRDNNLPIGKMHADSQDFKSQTGQSQESKRDNKQPVRKQNGKKPRIQMPD